MSIHSFIRAWFEPAGQKCNAQFNVTLVSGIPNLSVTLW